MAGISTIGVRLFVAPVTTSNNTKAPGTYAKVANLREFPDLIGEPEQIDVTTLDDDMRHYIPGVQDLGGSVSFVLLYETTQFNTLHTNKKTEQFWKVEFPSSTANKVDTFEWTGYGVPSIAGKGVNDALEFNLNILPTSDITYTKEGTPES